MIQQEDMAAYFAPALGVASKSGLDLISKSPAHYYAWATGHQKEDTEALRFGRALHCAALEPEKFAREYVVAPEFGDRRLKANKSAYEAFVSEHGGKELLDASTGQQLQGMLTSLRQHKAASRLLVGGTPEVSIRWTDKETGLKCKARADYWIVGKAIAVDLKSTLDASPEAFAKSIANFRYHVQDGFYRKGFEANGQPLDAFVFIAVEKTPPYPVACYFLEPEDVLQGQCEARENMLTLARCVEKNEWPAYGQAITKICLPRWAKRSF